MALNLTCDIGMFGLTTFARIFLVDAEGLVMDRWMDEYSEDEYWLIGGG